MLVFQLPPLPMPCVQFSSLVVQTLCSTGCYLAVKRRPHSAVERHGEHYDRSVECLLHSQRGVLPAWTFSSCHSNTRPSISKPNRMWSRARSVSQTRCVSCRNPQAEADELNSEQTDTLLAALSLANREHAGVCSLPLASSRVAHSSDSGYATNAQQRNSHSANLWYNLNLRLLSTSTSF